MKSYQCLETKFLVFLSEAIHKMVFLGSRNLWNCVKQDSDHTYCCRRSPLETWWGPGYFTLLNIEVNELKLMMSFGVINKTPALADESAIDFWRFVCCHSVLTLLSQTHLLAHYTLKGELGRRGGTSAVCGCFQRCLPLSTHETSTMPSPKENNIKYIRTYYKY